MLKLNIPRYLTVLSIKMGCTPLTEAANTLKTTLYMTPLKINEKIY